MLCLSAMMCNKVVVDSTKSNLVEHDSNVVVCTNLVRQTNKDWGEQVQGMPVIKIIIKQASLRFWVPIRLWKHDHIFSSAMRHPHLFLILIKNTPMTLKTQPV